MNSMIHRQEKSNSMSTDGFGLAGTHKFLRLTEWFLVCAGLTLAITGIAKVFSATGPARALDIMDPVFGLTFRNIFLFVGLLELLISFFCIFTTQRWFSLLAIMWLSTNFLVYRINLYFADWHEPCGCMGSLTQGLHLSARMADSIMLWVLAYLLLGSYFLGFIEWRRTLT